MTDGKGVTVLFLGSGFSKAVGGVPIQDKFLPFLFQTSRDWIDECGHEIGEDEIKLSDWMESIGDVELCMSHLHNLAYSGLATAESKKWAKKAIINLRALISKKLSGVSLNALVATKFSCWLHRLAGVVLVTTNYDWLIEKVLGQGRYFYPGIRKIKTHIAATKGRTRLYKLHGSIHWMERRKFAREELVRWQNDPEIIEWGWPLPPPVSRSGYRIFPAGLDARENYTPIMIPFFFQKEEWIEKKNEARWAPIFEDHWCSAKNFLRKNGVNEFYFVGYGLPPADHYMMSWLLNILDSQDPKPKITIVSKGDPKNLGKVLAPFNPTIYECGLEHFLVDHAKPAER